MHFSYQGPTRRDSTMTRRSAATHATISATVGACSRNSVAGSAAPCESTDEAGAQERGELPLVPASGRPALLIYEDISMHNTIYYIIFIT